VRRGFEQVLELAQSQWANHVALIADQIVGCFLVLVEIDVEVIEPEVGHHFLKLGAGVDVAGEALKSQLLNDDALGIFKGGNIFPLIRVETSDESDALGRLEGFTEGIELRLLHSGQPDDTPLRGEGENVGDHRWIGRRLCGGHLRGRHAHLAGLGCLCRLCCHCAKRFLIHVRAVHCLVHGFFDSLWR